jgi:hypothetical protein
MKEVICSDRLLSNKSYVYVCLGGPVAQTLKCVILHCCGITFVMAFNIQPKS